MLHVIPFFDCWAIINTGRIYIISFVENVTPNRKCHHLVSARPRSADFSIGICFETAKNIKAFESFFTGFQHSLWKFSTIWNLYSLKSWLWLAAAATIVGWPISNALFGSTTVGQIYDRNLLWNCEEHQSLRMLLHWIPAFPMKILLNWKPLFSEILDVIGCCCLCCALTNQ